MTARRDLAQVAATGDRLATLRAMRDRLAAQIDETNSGRDVASLTKQLQEVIDRIAALEPPKGVKDELSGWLSDDQDAGRDPASSTPSP